jgi:LysM repeat protein
MKLLNVFGLVVGAHLAVFTVIFATPGCRSTGKQKPKPEDTVAGDPGSPVSPVDSITPAPVTMSDADLNPATSTVSPVAPVAPSYGSSEVGVRFAPTRPTAPSLPDQDVAAPQVGTKATHTVAKGDSLWSIAKKYGIGVSELAAANQLSKSATLRLGQQISVPAKPAPAASDTDAANTYAVKSGDTLGAIARKHGTTVSGLRAANNLSGDNLRVGQKLVIPGNAAVLPSGSSSSSSSVVAPRAGSGTYTVSPGDTLGSIALRHGVKTGDLATLNTITDPAKLRVGQVLKLPAGAKAPGSSASATRSAPAAPAFAPAPVPVAPEPAPVPVESAPSTVTPVEPAATVEPMAVPVIRID